CRHCQDDDRLQRFYHCSSQERALLYERQRGQCAVCQGAHPQLYIYAVEGLGVLSLLCPRCTRVLNGLNRNPAIVESAIDYLDYFRERVLYGLELCYHEDWEVGHTGQPQGKTGRRPCAQARQRSPRRRVNEETYDYWSWLNAHTCFIC